MGLPDTVDKLSKGYEQALDEANAVFLSAGHQLGSAFNPPRTLV
jgi:hypothetical protein